MQTGINSKDIQNIWTRIFYAQSVMNYEIYFEMKEGSQLKYKIYSDYTEYRQGLSKLIVTKDKNEKIDVNFMESAVVL